MLNGKPSWRPPRRTSATPSAWPPRSASASARHLQHGRILPRQRRRPAPTTVSRSSTRGSQRPAHRGQHPGRLRLRRVKFWKGEIGDKPLRALKHSDVLTASPPARPVGQDGEQPGERAARGAGLAVRDQTASRNPVDGVKSRAYQKPPVDPFTSTRSKRSSPTWSRTTRPRSPSTPPSSSSRGFARASRSACAGRAWTWRARTWSSARASSAARRRPARRRTPRARCCSTAGRWRRSRRRSRAPSSAGEHVFRDPRDGKRWGGEPKFRFYWVPTLKRLGIRHRPQYNTRHTYATMMLMAGMKPAFCAGQMGHSVERVPAHLREVDSGRGRPGRDGEAGRSDRGYPCLSPKQA
jgi:hypothetical protein